MDTDTFWRLTIIEVQEVARNTIKRTLTKGELKRVEYMFTESTQWYDVLKVAIEHIGE